MASVQRIAMGYNNVYLVEEGGERVLVDTGPDYRGAWAEVREQAVRELDVRRRTALASMGDGYAASPRRGRWPTALRSEPFVPSVAIEGDSELPAGLRALAAPGHTPGNFVLFHPGEGWL